MLRVGFIGWCCCCCLNTIVYVTNCNYVGCIHYNNVMMSDITHVIVTLIIIIKIYCFAFVLQSPVIFIDWIRFEQWTFIFQGVLLVYIGNNIIRKRYFIFILLESLLLCIVVPYTEKRIDVTYRHEVEVIVTSISGDLITAYLYFYFGYFDLVKYFITSAEEEKMPRPSKSQKSASAEGRLASMQEATSSSMLTGSSNNVTFSSAREHEESTMQAMIEVLKKQFPD